MPRKLALLISLLAVVLICGVAVGEEGASAEWETWSRYGVAAGGFFNAVDSNVMLGVEGLGVHVDVENLLGLKASTTVFRAHGYWRYTQNRRHRLDLSWFAVRRGDEHVIDRDIEIGDTLFLEGTRLETTFDIDIVKLAYSYSFFQDDRIDLALSAGLFVMPIKLAVSATKETTRSANSADITAPLPVVGIRTHTVLTPRWYLRSGFELFYIEIGDFTGAITDLLAAVEYRPYSNLSFGLGVESFGLSVEAQGSDYPGIDFEGRMNFDYIGILFYVQGMW
jgi:hypothetical protein